MSHARSQHPNAVLTPMGRRRMVVCVLNDGWTIEATAQRFQVDAKTVRKWRDRFVADTSANGPASWPTSTSRSSPASPTGAAGGSTDDSMVPTTPRSGTGTSTPPSMTAPASPTRRSTETNKASPQRGSGIAPTSGSPPTASPSNGALTDNGPCYRSRRWLAALADTGVAPKRTRPYRPYRPRTNGKVERFHRILLEEWAYIRDWHNDHDRTAAYDGFMHFYNQHRSHGALGWATPTDTLNHLLGDNLPDMHS